MLKWAFNPELRAGFPTSQDLLQLTDQKGSDDTFRGFYQCNIPEVNFEEKKRSKKKAYVKRSLTVGYSAGRRNTVSLMKQFGSNLRVTIRRSPLAKSNDNIHQSKDDLDLVEKVEEEAQTPTIQDDPKCHFSRVFEDESAK